MMTVSWTSVSQRVLPVWTSWRRSPELRPRERYRRAAMGVCPYHQGWSQSHEEKPKFQDQSCMGELGTGVPDATTRD